MPFIEKHLGVVTDGTNPISHGVGLDPIRINNTTYGIGFVQAYIDTIRVFNRDFTLKQEVKLDMANYANTMERLHPCPTQNYILFSRMKFDSTATVEKYDTKTNTVKVLNTMSRGAVYYMSLAVFTNGDYVIANQYTGELYVCNKYGTILQDNLVAFPNRNITAQSLDVVVSSKRNIIAILDRYDRKIRMYDRKSLMLLDTYDGSTTLDETARMFEMNERGDLIVTYTKDNVSRTMTEFLQIDYITQKIIGKYLNNNIVASAIWKRYIGTYRDEVYFSQYSSSTNTKTLYVYGINDYKLRRTIPITPGDAVTITGVDNKYFYGMHDTYQYSKRLLVFDKNLTELNRDNPTFQYPAWGSTFSYGDQLWGPFMHGKGSWESFGKYWN